MTFRWIIFFTLITRISWAQSLSTSNLPILSIDTRGKTIVNEPKIPTKISLFDRGPGALNQISGSPTLKIWAGVEFRGSTSQEDFYFLPGLIKNLMESKFGPILRVEHRQIHLWFKCLRSRIGY